MLNLDDVYDAINDLFAAARESDEFEFCCTILRVRGMEGPGWDPLQESMDLIDNLATMIDAPIKDSFRMRLVLMLYCHVTEMNDFYSIVGNLLRIAFHNERYSMALFPNSRYPLQKIAEIKEWASDTRFAGLVDELNAMVVSPVRNAFFHSDYVLMNDSFNLRNGQTVDIDGTLTPAVPFEWLDPRVQTAVNSVRHVIRKTIESIRSYSEPKTVKGRFGPNETWMDLQLLVDPKWGLMGFQGVSS